MSEQPTLPIRLPEDRQTFYPSEVMKLLSVSDEQLRQLAESGVLVAINISLPMMRPVFRYTRESIAAFLLARNTRDNPDSSSRPLSQNPKTRNL
jgi:hypothetical protein